MYEKGGGSCVKIDIFIRDDISEISLSEIIYIYKNAQSTSEATRRVSV